MGVGGQLHAPAALPPVKRPGNHCIGGWVGPRAGLDGCGKSRPPPGFDPRTVQPVASRYTDWVSRPRLKKKQITQHTHGVSSNVKLFPLHILATVLLLTGSCLNRTLTTNRLARRISNYGTHNLNQKGSNFKFLIFVRTQAMILRMRKTKVDVYSYRAAGTASMSDGT